MQMNLSIFLDKNLFEAGNMNWHNGHLSDITDTFQTFIRHSHWHLIDNFGGYLAKANPYLIP